MRLQLVTCPDLIMGTGIGPWEMGTLKALEVLIKYKTQINLNIILKYIYKFEFLILI